MVKVFTFLTVLLSTGVVTAQDWNGIAIPADAGSGKQWELADSHSDDFNYTGKTNEAFTSKWNDTYHNGWDGPGLTQWRSNHSDVKDGNLEIKASRSSLSMTYTVNGVAGTYPKVDCGVVTAKEEVIYPLYTEIYMKVMNQTLSSNYWFLSRSDRQELDVIECYGGDRPVVIPSQSAEDQPAHMNSNWHIDVAPPGTNWNDQRDHYLPSREPLRNDYHRYGMHWIDSQSVDWYMDGVLVRSTRANTSDKIIDNRLYKYLYETMVMIIDVEDHDWISNRGIISTDEELADPSSNVMYVDWVRTYKPVSTGAVLEIDGTATIKAESFDSQNGVSVNAGVGINDIIKGEWAEYRFTVAESGSYSVEYFMSTTLDNAEVTTSLNGVVVSTDAVANTGDWELYKSVKMNSSIDLVAGTTYTLKVEATGVTETGWNWNMTEFVIKKEVSSSVANTKAVACKVYPNPTKDEVIIDFSESASFEEVRLLTVAGQLISSYPIKNGEKSIQVNVSGLTNGMYLLQVVGDVLQTQVLIKE